MERSTKERNTFLPQISLSSSFPLAIDLEQNTIRAGDRRQYIKVKYQWGKTWLSVGFPMLDTDALRLTDERHQS